MTALDDLTEKTVILVGGGSGLGKATAALVVAKGGHAVLAGRSAEKLEAAAASLSGGPGSVSTHPIDMMDAAAVADWFASIDDGAIHHLVISASSAVHGPFVSLPIEDAQSMFESKFWGPYRLAKHAAPKLAEGGSITFFSGVLSRRPGENCSALGACNAAVEGLTMALALELGPRLRVNCCSPGMVDTEAYAKMPADRRAEMYRKTGASLPVGRVGRAEELGQAVLYLMTNSFTTGVVLDVDGGHMIRQYNPR